MRLFSYIVRWDYGFAPNPFFGTCTIATCKPKLRRTAKVGDWIVGVGSKTQNRHGHIVYVMQVAEEMTFNEYWADERFARKKSNLAGSLKQAFGDNIYFHDRNGQWHQSNSRHSREDGSLDRDHVEHDTDTDKVLISGTYAYWGGCGPELPSIFRNWNGHDIGNPGRSHKCRFPRELVNAFVEWFIGLDVHGFLYEPLDWKTLP